MDSSDQKPKIVLVGGDGQPSGVPRHILHLAKALHQHAELTVISDTDKGGFTGLKLLNIRHIVQPGLNNRGFLTRPWHRTRTLIGALKDEAPDIVWLHTRLQVLLLRLIWALGIWRPTHQVMFTLHGIPFGPGHHAHLRKLFQLIEKALVSVGPPQDLVFLDHRSSGLIAHEIEARRLARHRVHVLPNCSDLAPYANRPDPTSKRIVMTGRTGRQKDYEFAVVLFAALPTNYRLTLCGPGTEDKRFRKRVAHLVPSQTFERITFTGPVKDVRPILQTAHAYLLTSRYEGTPIGTLEAFEAGLPVILRNFEGAAELLSRHPAGLLIGRKSLEEDALRIVRCLHRFDQNRTVLQSATKAAWEQQWSPAIFQDNTRKLVRSIWKRAHPTSEALDSRHDVQVLLQDPRKTSDAPVPILLPSYKAAAPSPENASPQ